MEEAIANNFLPNLFGTKTSDGMTPIESLRSLSASPVKNTGIGLFNPIDNVQPNYTASTLITSHLTAALKGRTPFHSTTHQQVLTTCKNELKHWKK